MVKDPAVGLALSSNGSVVSWPANLSGIQTNGVTNLLAIAGGGFDYGLKPNGSVIELNYNGALTLSGYSNIAAISVFRLG